MLGIIIFEGGDHIANARFVTPHLQPANRLLLLGTLIALAVVGFEPEQRPSRRHLPLADNTQFTYFADWDAGSSVMGKSLRSIASPD
jgi:hypothetical protein